MSQSLPSLCDQLMAVLPSLHTSDKHTVNSWPKVKKKYKYSDFGFAKWFIGQILHFFKSRQNTQERSAFSSSSPQ